MMTKKSNSDLIRFILSILLPFAACALQWLLWPFIKPFIWFLFYPAVFFSSWTGKFKGGISSTILSLILVGLFFFTPQHHFDTFNITQFLSFFIFFFMGVLFSYTFYRLDVINQKNLQLFKKTMELDELKTRFFTNISHELRTPLTLILGPIRNLLSSEKFENPDRKNLEIIERNALLLHHHVTDLLNVAQIDAGRMKITYSEVSLSRLARFMAANFESLAHEKNIRFHLSVPENLTAQTDDSKFLRIIQNLLSNAFKFTLNGGMIELSLREEQNQVILEVTDNGPGIPEEMREIVFDRFRQNDDSSSRHYEGTGLGLSIVKEFADLLGGHVSLSESASGGACFRVFLPLKAPPGAEINNSATDLTTDNDLSYISKQSSFPAINSAEVNQDSLPLILIVEDNHDLNYYLREILEENYQVVSAFDGHNGIELAKEFSPDLIITDIMMPGMDGIEMIRVLRALKGLERVPIIVLTAKMDEELRTQMIRENAQAFLNKPFSEQHLKAVISRWLKERKETNDLLYASDERFYKTLNEMIEGCQILDYDWRYIYVNGAAAEHGRKSIQELLGKKMTDVYPEIEQTALFSSLKQCMEQREPREMINEFKYENGETRIFELKIQPVSDGIIILSADITDREKAVSSLKESEIKLRTIFESSRDAIGVSKNGIHSMVNPAYAVMFGYNNPSELAGLPVLDLIAPGDRSLVREYVIKRDKKEPVPLFYTVKALKADGTEFDMEVSVSQYCMNDEYYTMVVLRDITERKTAEEKLKKLLKDRELLIQEIYHRTRNNMQVINAMIALKMSTEKLPASQMMLKEIMHRVQAMALVQGLLYQSQDLSSIRLSDYIRQLTDYLRLSYHQDYPGIELELGKLADLKVLLDVALPCGLLITELVSNSFHHAFIRAGTGKITISLENPSGSTAVLKVSDNGTGFSKNFDPQKNGKFGLKSILSMAGNQLNGLIRFVSSEGLTCEVSFQYDQYSNRLE